MEELKQKYCPTCKYNRPITDFPYRSDRPSGVRPRCKDCVKRYQAIRTAENRLKNPYATPKTKRCSICNIQKASVEFARANGRADGLQVVCKVCNAKRRELRKDQTMDRNLRRSYGISLKDLKQMGKAQKHSCAICEAPCPLRGSTSKALNVDHNHKTGKVRALLCPNCNKGLGCFADNPARLRLAAMYLDKYA